MKRIALILLILLSASVGAQYWIDPLDPATYIYPYWIYSINVDQNTWNESIVDTSIEDTCAALIPDYLPAMAF